MNDIRNECIKRGYGIPPILSGFQSPQEQFDELWFNYMSSFELIEHNNRAIEIRDEENHKLQKALDIACEHLENFSRFTEHGTILRNKEQWKEYLMNEKD